MEKHRAMLATSGTFGGTDLSTPVNVAYLFPSTKTCNSAATPLVLTPFVPFRLPTIINSNTIVISSIITITSISN